MRNRPWTSPSPAPAINHGGLVRVRQDSTNTCLPQTLISSVPNCAVSCLQIFASTNYPGSTCADTSDLNYLCTQNNNSDLTIGEGAVQCVVSFCRGQDQLNVDAYNICIGIQGALPNTAQTITATLIDTSTTSATMDNLPQTIGNPTSTQEVSMIVMDSGTPGAPAATATTSSMGVSTSSTENTSTGPQGTSGAVAMPEKGAAERGLSTGAVAGIAVGGAAMAVAVFGLLMFIFCIRRRRREKRDSQRQSSYVEATPPPNYQSPPKEETPTFTNNTNSLTLPNTNGRFYAPTQAVEEKRRSFWRRSIKPEEIGVAVSPRIPGNVSPVSASSQQSISRLLPIFPTRALWPAPLDIEASRERRRDTQRPMSDTTMSDIESAIQTTDQQAIYVDNQPFILEKAPPAKRQRTAPPPISLPVVPETSPSKARAQPPSSARIPLTPTYDNGNINIVSPPRSFRSPPFSGSTVGESAGTSSKFPLPIAEHKLAPSSTYAKRNVLQKRPPSGLPLRSLTSPPPIAPLEQPRNAPNPPILNATTIPERRESLTSEYTEIEEEDTTPEELNKELGSSSNQTIPRTIYSDIRADDQGQASPIKNLKYPQIPRSAAVSRQAEKPAQPRAVLALDPSSPASILRPTRDQLIRAGASFMQTDTTSSDGYLSDETIEWPQPPPMENSPRKGVSGLFQNPIKEKMARLRSNPASANRGPPPARVFTPSLNEVIASESRTSSAAAKGSLATISSTAPQRSPSTKARLTPNKAENGDLYLTVQDI